MESGVDDLVRRLGIAAVIRISVLRAGLGGNELWRVHRAHGDLVLRAFPPGAPPLLAEREQQAHRYAADHGLSVPEVYACQMLDDRPVLVLAWADGDRLSDAVLSGKDPDDLGRRSGAALARLHAAADPLPPLIAARSWLDWPEPVSELRALLEPYDTGRVGLHLDFHPENLIIGPDGRITVLDWANSCAGPPQADLARTRSILDLILTAVPELPEIGRRAVDRYWDGFLAGYRELGGDPAIPAPVQAWAYAAQRLDLAGSWVPPWYLDRLGDRVSDLIDAQ